MVDCSLVSRTAEFTPPSLTSAVRALSLWYYRVNKLWSHEQGIYYCRGVIVAASVGAATPADKSGTLFIRRVHCVCRELLSVQYCAAWLPLLPVNLFLVNSVLALLRSLRDNIHASCVGNRRLAVVAASSDESSLSILRERSAAACGEVGPIVDWISVGRFALFPRDLGGFSEAELSCVLVFVKNRGICLDGYLTGRAACTEVRVLRV
jgi:hypothetical protein